MFGSKLIIECAKTVKVLGCDPGILFPDVKLK